MNGRRREDPLNKTLRKQRNELSELREENQRLIERETTADKRIAVAEEVLHQTEQQLLDGSSREALQQALEEAEQRYIHDSTFSTAQQELRNIGISDKGESFADLTINAGNFVWTHGIRKFTDNFFPIVAMRQACLGLLRKSVEAYNSRSDIQYKIPLEPILEYINKSPKSAEDTDRIHALIEKIQDPYFRKHIDWLATILTPDLLKQGFVTRDIVEKWTQQLQALSAGVPAEPNPAEHIGRSEAAQIRQIVGNEESGIPNPAKHITTPAVPKLDEVKETPSLEEVKAELFKIIAANRGKDKDVIRKNLKDCRTLTELQQYMMLLISIIIKNTETSHETQRDQLVQDVLEVNRKIQRKLALNESDFKEYGRRLKNVIHGATLKTSSLRNTVGNYVDSLYTILMNYNQPGEIPSRCQSQYTKGIINYLLSIRRTLNQEFSAETEAKVLAALKEHIHSSIDFLAGKKDPSHQSFIRQVDAADSIEALRNVVSGFYLGINLGAGRLTESINVSYQLFQQMRSISVTQQKIDPSKYLQQNDPANVPAINPATVSPNANLQHHVSVSPTKFNFSEEWQQSMESAQQKYRNKISSSQIKKVASLWKEYDKRQDLVAFGELVSYMEALLLDVSKETLRNDVILIENDNKGKKAEGLLIIVNYIIDSMQYPAYKDFFRNRTEIYHHNNLLYQSGNYLLCQHDRITQALSPDNIPSSFYESLFNTIAHLQKHMGFNEEMQTIWQQGIAALRKVMEGEAGTTLTSAEHKDFVAFLTLLRSFDAITNGQKAMLVELFKHGYAPSLLNRSQQRNLDALRQYRSQLDSCRDVAAMEALLRNPPSLTKGGLIKKPDPLQENVANIVAKSSLGAVLPRIEHDRRALEERRQEKREVGVAKQDNEKAIEDKSKKIEKTKRKIAERAKKIDAMAKKTIVTSIVTTFCQWVSDRRTTVLHRKRRIGFSDEEIGENFEFLQRMIRMLDSGYNVADVIHSLEDFLEVTNQKHEKNPRKYYRDHCFRTRLILELTQYGVLGLTNESQTFKARTPKERMQDLLGPSSGITCQLKNLHRRTEDHFEELFGVSSERIIDCISGINVSSKSKRPRTKLNEAYRVISKERSGLGSKKVASRTKDAFKPEISLFSDQSLVSTLFRNKSGQRYGDAKKLHPTFETIPQLLGTNIKVE